MTTIGVIVVENFALMSFAAATEPFRAANWLAGRDTYRLRYFAQEPVVSSSAGVAVETEPLAAMGADLSMAFVVAGGGPADWAQPAVHRTLRRLDAAGVTLVGVSGGPYILAAAGLLSARAFTIHWEHAAAFAEAFADLAPKRARTVFDRDRITCGGGIAALDMAISLIRAELGPAFARRVSDWFLHVETTAAEGAQRATPAERWGVHHRGLLALLTLMEERPADRISRGRAAQVAGVSERQLDRLFAAHIGQTFRATAAGLRLSEAERLLHQSSLSVSEIAYATGFSNPSHLSRAFAARHGMSPTKARQMARTLLSR